VWLSVAKCCSVINIIRRHIDNRKLPLICILLVSHPLIFFRFLFHQYIVVFLFNTVIYVFLLKESMYSYCCLCILIIRPCILNVVYVYLLLSMYSYCCLCILIIRTCILNFVYVLLLFIHVFSSLSTYTYCCLCILRRGYPD